MRGASAIALAALVWGAFPVAAQDASLRQVLGVMTLRAPLSDRAAPVLEAIVDTGPSAPGAPPPSWGADAGSATIIGSAGLAATGVGRRETRCENICPDGPPECRGVVSLPFNDAAQAEGIGVALLAATGDFADAPFTPLHGASLGDVSDVTGAFNALLDMGEGGWTVAARIAEYRLDGHLALDLRYRDGAEERIAAAQCDVIDYGWLRTLNCRNVALLLDMANHPLLVSRADYARPRFDVAGFFVTHETRHYVVEGVFHICGLAGLVSAAPQGWTARFPAFGAAPIC